MTLGKYNKCDDKELDQTEGPGNGGGAGDGTKND